MSRPTRKLDTLQRWMQSVITHPLGIEAGIDSAEAQAEIVTNVDEIEDVVARSKSLGSVDRLAVYGNAYYSRLIDCMRELFPATAYAVGEEAFDGFVFEYLQHHPPQSYTLEHLADQFVSFLEVTRPDEDEEDASAATWADLIIDLARLEWTIDKVFDGPGVEDQSPLSQEQLQAIPPEAWPQAALTVAPCLRLLSFRYAVNDFYTAFRQDNEPELPDAIATFVAISRRDYIVRRFELSQPQHALLSEIVAGASVENAIAAAASFFAGGGEEAQLAEGLRRWFREWTAEGFFTDVVYAEA